MTKFHNVSSISQRYSIATLEENIKSFLDWSFLQIGGFINVDSATEDMRGNHFNVLKPTESNPKIWQTARKDWVYETGVSVDGSSPTPISGIYIDSNFIAGPTGSGNNTYTINYPLGNIVFDNTISANANVRLNYSYRYIQTYKSSDCVWWKELQKQTYLLANHINNQADYKIDSLHRMQMPAIMIEIVPGTNLQPWGLGTTRNIIYQDVFLHIFTENINQRNTISEILLYQKEKHFRLFDSKSAVADQKYTLNYNGSLNTNGYQYEQLISNYPSLWCNIDNSTTIEFNTFSSRLFGSTLKWIIEIFP
jgi:hypothetical protein